MNLYHLPTTLGHEEGRSDDGLDHSPLQVWPDVSSVIEEDLLQPCVSRGSLANAEDAAAMAMLL